MAAVPQKLTTRELPSTRPYDTRGPGRQNDDGKFVGLTGFLQGGAGVAKALAPAAVNSKRKIQWVVVPGVGANFHC